MVPSWVMYFDASIGLWSHLERIDPVGEYEEKSFVWVVLAVQQAQAVRSISAKTARFVFLDKVGSGAYGEVWRCFDTETRRLVAIKMFKNNRKCPFLLPGPGVHCSVSYSAQVVDWIRGLCVRGLRIAGRGLGSRPRPAEAARDGFAQVRVVWIPWRDLLNADVRGPSSSTPHGWIVDSVSWEKLALKEIYVLHNCKHPNIVNLIGAYKCKSGKICMAMDFMEGTLCDALEASPDGLSPDQVKWTMWQLLTATAFLHEKQIIHRDLKPANILINPDGSVKVCDFGFARTISCNEEGPYTPYIFTRPPRATYVSSTRAPPTYVSSTRAPPTYMSSTRGPPTYVSSTRAPPTYVSSTRAPPTYVSSTRGPSTYVAPP
eukprot:gene21860-28890_t